MGGTNEAKVGLWPPPDLAVVKDRSGSGRKRVGLWWQNGAAGRGGFRRWNGRIRSAVGASRRVLRTQSVGSAAAEKSAAEAEKSAAEAEKVSAAAEKRSAVAKHGGCGGGETAAGTPRRRPGKSPAGEMKRLTRRTWSAYPGFFRLTGESGLPRWTSSPVRGSRLPCRPERAEL